MILKWVYFISVLIVALLYVRSRGPERFYQQFFPILLCFSPLYLFLVLTPTLGYFNFVYFVTLFFLLVLAYNYKLSFQFDIIDYLILGWIAWDVLACVVAANTQLALVTAVDKLLGCYFPYFLARTLVLRAHSLRLLVCLSLTVTAIAVLTPLEGFFNITPSSIIQPIWPDPLPASLFRRGGLFRVFSVFEHPIYAGAFFSVAIFIGAVLYKIRLFRNRNIALAIIFINAIALYLTVSRTSYILVPVIILLINYVFVNDKRKYVTIGVVAVLILLLAGQPIYNALLKGGEEQAGSTAYREVLLQTYLPQILESPFFGYANGPVVVGIQWSIDNYYLYLTLRFGVPSFVLFLLAVVAVVIRSILNLERLTLQRDKIMSWLITSSILYLSIVAISAWLPVQVRELLFILLGLATNYFAQVKYEPRAGERIRWI